MTLGMSLVVAMMAALVSCCVTPLVRRVALAYGVLDQPNHRKVHRRPIPRLGGVAVFLAWLVAVRFVGTIVVVPEGDLRHRLTPILLAGAAGLLIGLWDDLRNLSGRQKLLGQLAVGVMLIVSGLQIDRVSNPFGGELLFSWWLSVCVTLFWVVGMICYYINCEDLPFRPEEELPPSKFSFK